MVKVIYPGSFDPFTNGHQDMLIKSGERFEQVVVAVGQNPDKKYMFSFPERVEMIKGATKARVYEGMNIDVKPFGGLLSDFTFEQGSKTVIRGIRGIGDFQGEETLKNILEKEGIVSMYLFAEQNQTHVSSSVTKSLLKEQGFIQDYVSLNVKHFLEARMNGQYIVGLTGTIGAGKSYITEKFLELGKQENIPVHNIDLDKIGHRILEVAIEDGYKQIRQKLIKKFGDSIGTEGGFIDRKKLGEIVFNDSKKRKLLDEIMFNPMQVRIRTEIYGKKGIILLNGALLAEAGITDLANNNIVLIGVDNEVQKERLSGRNLDNEQIERRVKNQFSTDRKKEVISASIKTTGYGNLVDFDNNGNNDDLIIEEKFNQMLCTVDIYGELRMKSVFTKLGIEDKWIDIYAKLKPMYDTSERLYHNWFHIIACLNILYEIKKSISHEEFIALFFAILFHDAIYSSKAKAGENERQSANFAKDFLKKLGLEEKIIERASYLISLTASHKLDGNDLIGAYMIDIDLSILGQPWDIYHGGIDSIKYGYMRAVRNEYSNYKEEDYKKGRLAFLEGKSGGRIFKTPYFIEKYEKQAQENIRKEIIMLGGNIS
ncbi:pantetheine-phosphate adenylyltransferase [Candidatus Gracilibacteria bacterium]|nr:pantetheine-phosphate adenylyltransferase [Candidatus Gracilibacteria bacterium]NUJ99128.1 pantetheine-phosphate adenylyltransferase [Candidatus Gracilibacteria bacterium]